VDIWPAISTPASTDIWNPERFGLNVGKTGK